MRWFRLAAFVVVLAACTDDDPEASIAAPLTPEPSLVTHVLFDREGTVPGVHEPGDNQWFELHVRVAEPLGAHGVVRVTVPDPSGGWIFDRRSVVVRVDAGEAISLDTDELRLPAPDRCRKNACSFVVDVAAVGVGLDVPIRAELIGETSGRVDVALEVSVMATRRVESAVDVETVESTSLALPSEITMTAGEPVGLIVFAWELTSEDGERSRDLPGAGPLVWDDPCDGVATPCLMSNWWGVSSSAGNIPSAIGAQLTFVFEREPPEGLDIALRTTTEGDEFLDAVAVTTTTSPPMLAAVEFGTELSRPFPTDCDPGVRLFTPSTDVVAGEPFLVTMEARAVDGIRRLWFFGDERVTARTEPPNAETTYWSSHWVTIDEPGPAVFGANVRDITYPNPDDGRAHQASEGCGLAELVLDVAPRSGAG